MFYAPAPWALKIALGPVVTRHDLASTPFCDCDNDDFVDAEWTGVIEDGEGGVMMMAVLMMATGGQTSRATVQDTKLHVQTRGHDCQEPWQDLSRLMTIFDIRLKLTFKTI